LFPEGSLVFSSRSSSKKGWASASRGFKRYSGLYTSSFAIKLIAVSGVLLRKSLGQGFALIYGNLNSE
jgi:hypothetical protein